MPQRRQELGFGSALLPKPSLDFSETAKRKLPGLS
jgi:hypothetical protein